MEQEDSLGRAQLVWSQRRLTKGNTLGDDGYDDALSEDSVCPKTLFARGRKVRFVFVNRYN